MNKPILKASTLLATLLISGAALSAIVSATTIGGDYTSSANLTLEAGEGPTTPLDPENPDDPITPEIPGTGGEGGNLTVDYGSTLFFGKQSISSQAATYYAHPDLVRDSGSHVKAVPLYAQVTDQSGELAGWTLTLTQAAQLHLGSGSDTDPGYALNGATINFSGGTIVGGYGLEDGVPSTFVESGTLIPGHAVQLVGAGNGEGAGTWLYHFGAIGDYDTSAVNTADTSDHTGKATKSPITLTIPAGVVQKAAAYSTELYWSLQAVPGGDWTGETDAKDVIPAP
ncbi:WxL domain-containing protein [Pseudolactococcus reticulitermitis]|uniref:WxL domain-containing protein n=1 Tax=Pseudolactococcus reticulitermitis TaxID=2025039 RepID=A0A224X1D7_9LACT|nr:WxL domain-containing protein [Lactococcus reticulitermitis]GAX48029.1 hypothetical protein RsY01_1643 [Lactococcus reticulitermitis]